MDDIYYTEIKTKTHPRRCEKNSGGLNEKVSLVYSLVVLC